MRQLLRLRFLRLRFLRVPSQALFPGGKQFLLREVVCCYMILVFINILLSHWIQHIGSGCFFILHGGVCDFCAVVSLCCCFGRCGR